MKNIPNGLREQVANPTRINRTALPPDDATLAAHELTQRIRNARLTAEREEEAANQTLAAAGEREALAALASVLPGRPLEPESPADAGIDRGRSSSPRSREGIPRKHGERISRAKPIISHAELPATPDDAYKLMDAVFKKWRTNFAKDPRGANRELARDLGGDTAIYLRAQILRLPDMLDAINKLGMLKAEKGDDGGDEDLMQDIEDLRALMRGDRK
jgi:hypothetical protein